MFRKFLIVLGCLFILGQNVLALEIPKNDGYLTDLANVINKTEEEEIENLIQKIEDDTTVEIAILTLLTTGENEIGSYTFDIANAWGVGKKENDNGIMIVVAVNDHQWFIATGYGVEGTLPDAIAKRIGERNFPSNFRVNNYAQGFLDTLNDINGYLIADPTVITNYQENPSIDQSLEKESIFFTIIIILAIFLIPIKAIWVRKNKKQRIFRSLITTGLILIILWLLLHLVVGVIFAVYSLISDWIDTSSGGDSSGSGWSSGGSRWSSGSSGSSSGGFGGFGGGSFGGGGAGGKW